MTLKENDSFQPFKDELNTICMSCRLGMSCFNFALKLILAEQLQEKTDKAVQKLMEHDIITTEAIVTYISFMLHLLHCILAIGPGSNTIQQVNI